MIGRLTWITQSNPSLGRMSEGLEYFVMFAELERECFSDDETLPDILWNKEG